MHLPAQIHRGIKAVFWIPPESSYIPPHPTTCMQWLAIPLAWSSQLHLGGTFPPWTQILPPYSTPRPTGPFNCIKPPNLWLIRYSIKQDCVALEERLSDFAGPCPPPAGLSQVAPPTFNPREEGGCPTLLIFPVPPPRD